MQRVTNAPIRRIYIPNFPPLPLPIRCSHGLELITNPTAEVSDAISKSDIVEILQFIPAFHNALKSRFPNASCTLDGREDAVATIVQELLQSIVDQNNPDIVPDVTDPIYLKVVTACLVALGTEYLLHARVDADQKKRYTAMAAVIAYAAGLFSQDFRCVAHLQCAIDEGMLEEFLGLFLNSKNTCNCLKEEEEGENSDDNVCAHCKQRKDKLLQCAGCKSVKYCGKECQRSDWPNHKTVCKRKKDAAK